MKHLDTENSRRGQLQPTVQSRLGQDAAGHMIPKGRSKPCMQASAQLAVSILPSGESLLRVESGVHNEDESSHTGNISRIVTHR